MSIKTRIEKLESATMPTGAEAEHYRRCQAGVMEASRLIRDEPEYIDALRIVLAEQNSIDPGWAETELARLPAATVERARRDSEGFRFPVSEASTLPAIVQHAQSYATDLGQQ